MRNIKARLLAPNQWIRAKRNRHVKLPADLEAVKAGLGDADDFKWMMLDRDLASEDRVLAAIFPLPECIADDSARRSAPPLIIFHREQSPPDGLHAEHTKEISTHVQAVDLVCFAARRDV